MLGRSSKTGDHGGAWYAAMQAVVLHLWRKWRHVGCGFYRLFSWPWLMFLQTKIWCVWKKLLPDYWLRAADWKKGRKFYAYNASVKMFIHVLDVKFVCVHVQTNKMWGGKSMIQILKCDLIYDNTPPLACCSGMLLSRMALSLHRHQNSMFVRGVKQNELLSEGYFGWGINTL